MQALFPVLCVSGAVPFEPQRLDAKKFQNESGLLSGETAWKTAGVGMLP